MRCKMHQVHDIHALWTICIRDILWTTSCHIKEYIRDIHNGEYVFIYGDIHNGEYVFFYIRDIHNGEYVFFI